MKEEIWKPVLGGWYEVSNLGQLKAMGKRKKIVKQYISKRGYYRYHVKKAAGKAYNTRDTNVGRYCRKERNHKTLRFEYAA